jgi:hypothetical protein
MMKPIYPTQREIKDAAWAIVKDGRGMKDSGHGAAYRWARAYLNLDDRDTVYASRAVNDTERDDKRVTR